MFTPERPNRAPWEQFRPPEARPTHRHAVLPHALTLRLLPTLYVVMGRWSQGYEDLRLEEQTPAPEKARAA
jgi:hypothetical protein